MVAQTKDQAKVAFARRFNESLDEMPGCPPATERGGRGRAAWVARRYKVSNQGATKWLTGEAMPDQANMARLAEDLNVNPFWLWAGQEPRRPVAPLEIVGLWSETDEFGQDNILQNARAWHRARPRGKPNPPDEPQTE